MNILYATNRTVFSKCIIAFSKDSFSCFDTGVMSRNAIGGRGVSQALKLFTSSPHGGCAVHELGKQGKIALGLNVSISKIVEARLMDDTSAAVGSNPTRTQNLLKWVILAYQNKANQKKSMGNVLTSQPRTKAHLIMC